MRKLVRLIAVTIGLSLSNVVVSQTYTYDQSGRVIGITYSDGKEIGYQYDASGNIASVENVAQTDSTSPGSPSNPDDSTNIPATPSSGGGGGGSFGIDTLFILLALFIPIAVGRFRRKTV